jgi:hypothetical protein
MARTEEKHLLTNAMDLAINGFQPTTDKINQPLSGNILKPT